MRNADAERTVWDALLGVQLVNEAVVHGCDAANAAHRPATLVPVAAALISSHISIITSPPWEMQRPASAHALLGTGQTLQWRAMDTADDTGA